MSYGFRQETLEATATKHRFSKHGQEHYIFTVLYKLCTIPIGSFKSLRNPVQEVWPELGEKIFDFVSNQAPKIRDHYYPAVLQNTEDYCGQLARNLGINYENNTSWESLNLGLGNLKLPSQLFREGKLVQLEYKVALKGFETGKRLSDTSFLDGVQATSYIQSLDYLYLGSLKSIVSRQTPVYVKAWFGKKLIHDFPTAHRQSLLGLAHTCSHMLLGSKYPLFAKILLDEAAVAQVEEDNDVVQELQQQVMEEDVIDEELQEETLDVALEKAKALEKMQSEWKEKQVQNIANRWEKCKDKYQMSPEMLVETKKVYDLCSNLIMDDTFRLTYCPKALVNFVGDGWKPSNQTTLKDLLPFLIFIVQWNLLLQAEGKDIAQRPGPLPNQNASSIHVNSQLLAAIFVQHLKDFNANQLADILSRMRAIQGVELPETVVNGKMLNGIANWSPYRQFLWKAFFPTMMQRLTKLQNKAFAGTIVTNGFQISAICYNMDHPTSRSTVAALETLGCQKMNTRYTSLDIVDKYQPREGKTITAEDRHGPGFVPFLPNFVKKGVHDWPNYLGKRCFKSGINSLNGLKTLVKDTVLGEHAKVHPNLKSPEAIRSMLQSTPIVLIDIGRWHMMVILDCSDATYQVVKDDHGTEIGISWNLNPVVLHAYLPNSLSGIDTPAAKAKRTVERMSGTGRLYYPKTAQDFLGQKETFQAKRQVSFSTEALEDKANCARQRQQLRDHYVNTILSYADLFQVCRAAKVLNLPVKLFNPSVDSPSNQYYTQAERTSILSQVRRMTFLSPLVLFGDGTSRGEEFVGPVPGLSPVSFREYLSRHFFVVLIDEYLTSQVNDHV